MISIRDVQVAPGGRTMIEIPVTTMASGYRLTIPVHILAGAAPGPTVALISTHHGDEIFSVELVRQTAEVLGRESFRGRAVLVPVANPIAFETGTRHTPVDMFNLNRVFPGTPDGWITEQIAHALTTALVPGIDAVIDYHCGGPDTEIHYTYTRPATTEIGRRIHDLALLTGAEVLWLTDLPRGTFAGCAEERGIPWAILEVGGSPSHGTPVGTRGLEGTLNVLRALGVLDGAPTPSRAKVQVSRGGSLRPHHGGLFYPEVGAEALGAAVPRGTVLARVRSPYTLEELEVLRAPYDPTYIMMVRSRISRVHPGDYAYILGDGATATPLR
ncbi:MAG: succinylglutamate desuccinylase/aspartoacylase family protein [Armatimonadetes bacterium]|nr:succinylglutamate desuccinylase/aspartoacylase family protein [Armatimonadota bacterium]